MSRRGFNLAEVLLAVFLITLALLAVVGVFTASLPFLSHNREAATASALARSLHEEMLARGGLPTTPTLFRGSVPDPPVAGFPPAPYPRQQVEGRDYDFEVRVDPEEVPPLGERAQSLAGFIDK